MENTVKVNTSEIVMKVTGAIIGIMLAIISYFLVQIDQNVKNLSTQNAEIKQNFAVFQATKSLEKDMYEAKFKAIELQIDNLNTRFDNFSNEKKK